MYLYHDSRDPMYRSPLGAMPCGKKLRLRVFTEGLHRVYLRLWWQNAEKLLPKPL